MIKVTVDVVNPKADTIYAVLKGKLGREPRHSELVAEVKRIINA
jgi:hypothetical protein